ncbi:MAG: NAD(P)/FAD-dependent oxidoreductase [Acidimicrobiia bacterium]
MRVAVIGGGIAGASAAFFLAERCDVVLLEREIFCGYHTTGRSAALLTEAWEHGVPAMLTAGSRPFLEDPPDGFADVPLLSSLPVLIVGAADRRSTIEEMASEASERTEVQFVSGVDVRSACPVLGSELAAGVLEPGSTEIDVAALHQGYLRGARERGANIVTNAAVVSLARSANGWTVDAGDDSYDADVVVNAAGAWSDELARAAGVTPLGLQPFRRTAFAFEPDADIEDWPMVIEVDESFYFKPERTVVMGSLCEETPMPPHDVQPEEIDVALAIDRIQAATDLSIPHVKRTWAGLRTFAPDRDPINGFDADVGGFYWLAGQGGFGIMTSPAMGRIAAGQILDGEMPDDLKRLGLTSETLSPSRLRAGCCRASLAEGSPACCAASPST